MTPTDEPQIPQCPLCSKPLGEIELNLNRKWHYDCQICHICKQPVTVEMVEKCIGTGKSPSHPICSEVTAIAELKTKKIPVLQSHVDAMNNEILSLRHDMKPTAEDINQLAEHLNKLHEYVANVSWMLKLERDKISIAASQEYAHQIKTERKAKAATAEQNAKDEQKRIEKQAKLKAERENPALRDYRKSVEGLAKTFSCSYEKAEEMAASMGIVKPQAASE